MNRSFFIPVQRGIIVVRPRIIESALAGNPALIVLHGGGGAGKTVAASQIARAFPDRASDRDTDGRRCAAVWVRQGASGVGASSLWADVMEALSSAGLIADKSLASSLLSGGVSTATSEIIASAISEIEYELLLVFDQPGYWETTANQQSLIEVLELTSTLTALITTRRPAKLLTSTETHVRVGVQELHARDLEFTADELIELILRRAPELSKQQQNHRATHIFKQSGGWPLAAHALIVESTFEDLGRGTGRRGSFVREFVTRLLDDADEQTRLGLCASAFFEEVSTHVLAAMLEIPESEAEALLESAFEQSFGYWEDDAGVRWYRHQGLLREELQLRANHVMNGEQLRGMHERAAHAFRATRPRLAKEAAVHAESWELLSDLLVKDLEFTVQREHIHRLSERIPSRVHDEYPIIAAFCLIEEYAFPNGRFGQVLTALKHLAGRRLEQQSRESGLSGVSAAALRMAGARLSGSESLSIEMAARVQQLLEEFPADDAALHSDLLAVALTQTAITLIHSGRFVESERLVESLLEQDREVLPHNQAHAIALTAWSCAWRGDLCRSRNLVNRAAMLEVPLGWQNSYIGAGFRIAASMLALEAGEIDEAQLHLDALSEHESTIEHWPYLAYLSTLITESRLGPQGALDYLESQLQQRRRRFAPTPTSIRMLQNLKARLMWHSRQLLAPAQRGAVADISTVITALSRGENDAALGLATTLSLDPAIAGNVRRKIELLLLQAESARRLGNEEVASESASAASTLMTEHGITLPMRMIAQETVDGLAVLAPELPVLHSSRGSSREIKPLTSAELRALIAVIETGTVREAAQSLFLSPETVKGYMKQVYRKLGVTSRPEAIRVASEAGLLSDLLGNSHDERGARSSAP